jgi:hypothetical protein
MDVDLSNEGYLAPRLDIKRNRREKERERETEEGRIYR